MYLLPHNGQIFVTFEQFWNKIDFEKIRLKCLEYAGKQSLKVSYTYTERNYNIVEPYAIIVFGLSDTSRYKKDARVFITSVCVYFWENSQLVLVN